MEKETNRANFFKVYDTIVNLLGFTIKQYDSLIKKEKITLKQLFEKENPEKIILKKYRCVLDLVSQCCDGIRKFSVPTIENGCIDIHSEEYFYKNQLRALFLPNYYLYYRAIFKDSLDILSIDTKGNDLHFKYQEKIFEINISTDVFDKENENNIPNEKHIYFIATAMKNIIDAMENRNSDDYYQFRAINKEMTNDK